MADFWAGFGQGFGKSYESSFESASRRLEERRKLERAAKKERDKAVSGLMAQGRGVELHGGDSRRLFSEKERTEADLALGPTKGGVRPDGLTPILPEMQRAPFKDMVSGATKSQVDAAAAFGPSLVEQLGKDREARREESRNLGASLSTPMRDFELTDADLKGKTPEQIKYMKFGAAEVKRKVLEPLKSEIYTNNRRAIDVENDRRNFLGNPSTYEDVRTFYSTLKIPDLVQVMSDDNIKQREAENKILGEYVSITKNPYVMPHSKIAEEADLIASINRQAKALADTDPKDLKYEGLDKAYEESKIGLAKLRNEVGVNFSELEKLIADHKELEGQKDAQRKLIWDTNAKAAIARVDEFKKIIDPESFKGGEEGSFDDSKSLYRTTYFKEVKDPVTEETYTDVVPDFYPWLNKFNIRVPPPTAAGLGTLIQIGTGGRQESIVYMPEPVATGEKGQKPLQGEVEGSETVVFERERHDSNMTKAQKDIIKEAREGGEGAAATKAMAEGGLAITKAKRLIKDATGRDAEVVDIRGVDAKQKAAILNQAEGVLFKNEHGDDFIRIGTTLYELR